MSRKKAFVKDSLSKCKKMLFYLFCYTYIYNIYIYNIYIYIRYIYIYNIYTYMHIYI